MKDWIRFAVVYITLPCDLHNRFTGEYWIWGLIQDPLPIQAQIVMFTGACSAGLPSSRRPRTEGVSGTGSVAGACCGRRWTGRAPRTDWAPHLQQKHTDVVPPELMTCRGALERSGRLVLTQDVRFVIDEDVSGHYGLVSGQDDLLQELGAQMFLYPGVLRTNTLH